MSELSERLFEQANGDASYRRMHLDWCPFTPETPPPMASSLLPATCFFTDGCATYYAGFYAPDGRILVATPDGDYAKLTLSQVERIRFWAWPGNFRTSTGAIAEAEKLPLKPQSPGGPKFIVLDDRDPK